MDGGVYLSGEGVYVFEGDVDLIKWCPAIHSLKFNSVETHVFATRWVIDYSTWLLDYDSCIRRFNEHDVLFFVHLSYI